MQRIRRFLTPGTSTNAPSSSETSVQGSSPPRSQRAAPPPVAPPPLENRTAVRQPSQDAPQRIPEEESKALQQWVREMGSSGLSGAGTIPLQDIKEEKVPKIQDAFQNRADKIANDIGNAYGDERASSLSSSAKKGCDALNAGLEALRTLRGLNQKASFALEMDATEISAAAEKVEKARKQVADALGSIKNTSETGSPDAERFLDNLKSALEATRDGIARSAAFFRASRQEKPDTEARTILKGATTEATLMTIAGMEAKATDDKAKQALSRLRQNIGIEATDFEIIEVVADLSAVGMSYKEFDASIRNTSGWLVHESPWETLDQLAKKVASTE